MKLHDVRFAGERLIEAYGDDGFRLTDGRHDGSILILPRLILPFDCPTFETFEASLFEPVFEAQGDIEIMLFGTGPRQHFPSIELRRRFLEAGIAFEPMDTGAACRTYNILVSEDRRVAAALIAV